MKRSRSSDTEGPGSGHGAHDGKRSRIDSPGALVQASASQEDESTLCIRCSSISASDLFQFPGAKGNSYRIMGLGTLNSPASKSCPGCRLFASVSGEDINATSSKPKFLYAHTAIPTETWGRKGWQFAVALEEEEDDLDHHVHKYGALAATNPEPNSGFFKAQTMLHDGANFELLRDWLSCCTKHHTKCRRYASQARTPRDLKLIDCETRRVVRAEAQPYIALSYVWGLAALGDGHDDRVRNGQIADDLPKTIEDAIMATMMLGFRYLWIDRYCIDQENAEETRVQIGQMNLIYRNAELTIIAAAGEDPRFGLPGVSTTNRTGQASAKFGNVELVSILPHPIRLVSRSKWNTRGWTYQEGYFSIRRLAFTESQAYFQCYNGAAVETIDHLREDGTPRAVEDKDEGDQDAYEILEHLVHYGGKQLTHDSDALNAVIGVFNDYGYKYGATPHYLGVPIVRYSNFDLFRSQGQRRRVTEAFLIGLSWMNEDVGRRRNLWPSWSWAEWVVKFEFCPPHTGGDRSDSYTLGTDFVVKPRVCIETKSGYPLDLENRSTLDTISRSPGTLSHFIRIDTWTVGLQIRAAEDKESDGAEQQGAVSTRKKSRRLYAYLKDSDVEFKMRFWPMTTDQSYVTSGNGQPSQSSGARQAGEIVGVLLSKLNLQKNEYYLNFMVVQSRGAYFERIGHCSLLSRYLPDLVNRCGPAEPGWVFGWTKFHKTTSRFCARYMRRRSVRIG